MNILRSNFSYNVLTVVMILFVLFLARPALADHCTSGQNTVWIPPSYIEHECVTSGGQGSQPQTGQGSQPQTGQGSQTQTGQGSQNQNTTLGGGSIQLFDPIGKSIEDIFRAILDIIMVFAIPIIVFFIVWAGFLYVTAAGSQDKITKATHALTYAVIGGVIVLGANVLLAVITNTISLFG